jgi:hydroxymethylglutaryl-CoA reductase
MSPKRQPTDSRIPGFYDLPVPQRQALVIERLGLSQTTARHLSAGGGLEPAVADRLSENVVATHGLPLSLGLNFVVNGTPRVVPMTIEEPSVVAAASHGAKMVRALGGFSGRATPPVMTAQVQLWDVPDPDSAGARLEAHRAPITRAADAAIPGITERGGGLRDLETRVVDPGQGLVVVHLHIDVRDAMGANIVDTVAESAAPAVVAAIGGRVGLRILTNLPLRRTVDVVAQAPVEAVGGAEVAAAIERASKFAEADPFRAVTHNKGVMNGVDAVAVALGQDWRAIEAGAHAFASVGGVYRPLSVWRVRDEALEGELKMPLAVGTVGGCAGAHPGVRAALEILGVRRADELAVVMASVGLATNLAALRALAAEGIQAGHMRLHRRRLTPPGDGGGEAS